MNRFRKDLDFRTRLSLKGLGIIMVQGTDQSIDEYSNADKKKIVHMFHDDEDFKKYFKDYSVNVDDEIIKLAILTKTRKGQILAYKWICDCIIAGLSCSELEDDSINSLDTIGSYSKVKVLGK